ncbi:MAG: PTS mannitol transporter subunit IICBA [Lachnospiraceae bacterium]|nr:PTS mannitol transporter subunit IICBA [Lachnospiraceae bacterium]
MGKTQKRSVANIQKFGGALSAMVMPNIGAFIAWGLLAALFIDTGWIPNEYLNQLVGPTLKYLMPILIGYTGGYNIYGRRGGVAGALATMGVVIGADITMLIGGMAMGPLGAAVIRWIDKRFEGKVKPGMEMLVDNFSLGIAGALLMVLGLVIVEPIMSAILTVLTAGVQWLVNANLLPFTSIFVQPAQVLFLNNAINHGIMIPIGIEEAAATGKSLLFLVEANGGTWFGLLLAFAVFGKGNAKKSAPGASLIMFFGGIGEVAFPYALSKPITILGPMAGNIVALYILQIFNGGTVAAVSPGSFLALMAMTPKSAYLVNIFAYFAATAVAFLVTAFFLRRDKAPEITESAGKPAGKNEALDVDVSGTVNKVAFACDAGMGSSVMGVAILSKKLRKAGIDVEICHTPINEIPKDADLIVTNQNLADRAAKAAPGKPILTLTNFMNEEEYDQITETIRQLKEKEESGSVLPAGGSVETSSEDAAEKIHLSDQDIVLNAKFPDKKTAIEACADILIQNGYVEKQYKQDMIRRDEEASVYLGNGVALPHGLAESKDTVKRAGICFIQVPEGVDFDGETAYLLVGVAGKKDDHVTILAHVAQALMDDENIEKLKKTGSKEEVISILDF